METRVDKVAEKHKNGYNCAQAVACAYCDLVGIDEETMFRMTEGLGLGMGGMEGTCGAVTAACVIAGAKNSTVEMGGPGSKGATYKISKEIVRRFKEESGSSGAGLFSFSGLAGRMRSLRLAGPAATTVPSAFFRISFSATLGAGALARYASRLASEFFCV